MKKHATLSPCRRYRYWLERSWAETGRGFVNFVMLNPSTADETEDDATIRKVIGFAKRWGYDGVHVVNLFALRSTNPSGLITADICPVGPVNDGFFKASVLSAERTIVGWGSESQKLVAERVKHVSTLLDPTRTFVLRFNQDWSPRHPLYAPYSSELVPWTSRGAP